jgi:hypothetical protein
VFVQLRHEDEVIAAAEDCPGECIFLEHDLASSIFEMRIVDAVIV